MAVYGTARPISFSPGTPGKVEGTLRTQLHVQARETPMVATGIEITTKHAITVLTSRPRNAVQRPALRVL